MKKFICALLAAVLCILSVSALGEVEVPEIVIGRKFEIPDNEAMRFLDGLGVGWNLGNTFDANECTWLTNELEYESAWCGAKTTREMMKLLRETGFTTIRIPVSWHNHVSVEDFTISERWLNRVRQVVDWALEEGLYVILNTHHDVDKNYYYPTSACYETSEHYIVSIWTQLAACFADYDEHLIFESMNEPRMKDTNYEWYLDNNNASCRDAADCINRLNQAFVDTIRASGGNNADRYLMVPAYDASPDCALSSLFVMPTDPAENKLIISVHSYSPYNFALEGGAGMRTFSLDSQSQKSAVATFMNTLYTRYISKGIPVIIGEFGSRDRNGNLQDRVNHAAWYVISARVRGIPCVWWDNGAFSGNGELFGLMNRTKAVWSYPEIVEAMMQYKDYRKTQE